MRAIAIASVLSLTAACVGELTSFHPHDDDRSLSVTLEGDALRTELENSPVREAPIPFVRLGVVMDAPTSFALEVSTSPDGDVWSDWRTLTLHHIEVEAKVSFVAELAADFVDIPGATAAPVLNQYYRLRAGAGTMPSFVNIEFIDSTLSDTLEDGTDGTDGTGGAGVASTAESLTVGDAVVNDRAAWGARAARCSSAHSPYRLTIHHTVTPNNDSLSAQARLRQIQSYHQDVRGWCDIGYHYLVSGDGRLWQGRPDNRLGSHVGGANTGNVGISFMGTHDSVAPSETQLNAVATLVAGVAAKYGITISSANIKGHRDRGSTTCPGDALYAKLATIIARAQGGGGGTEPPPPTPSGTITIKGVLYEGSDTSARISGATVRIGSRSVTTSATGFFEFTNLDPGTYELAASAAGFTPRVISRLATDAETWASFGLSRSVSTGTAILQGVVYTGGDSSNRIPFAEIQLSTGHSATADANGFYKITDLPDGEVRITASKDGASASVDRNLVGGETVWGSVQL